MKAVSKQQQVAAHSALYSSQLECDLKDCKPVLVRHIQDLTM